MGTKAGPKAGGQKEGYRQSRTWFAVAHVNMFENSHNNTASSGELKNNPKSHITASYEALDNLGKPQGCPRDAQDRPKRNPKRALRGIL